MKTTIAYIRAATACWLTFAFAPAPHANALDFSRLEHWTGNGTHRAALVIDWNDGNRPEALAWGFRWNGAVTALDLWQAVTNADRGLTGLITNESGRLRITGIEYRRPARPGDMLPATGHHDVHRSAYARDHTGDTFRAGAWHVWTGYGTNYAPSLAELWTNDIALTPLTNDMWLCLSFSPAHEITVRRPGFALGALHYPFASSVRAYAYGMDDAPVDWIDLTTSLTNATTALGRPTVDTTGGAWDDEPGFPVVPVQPAFRAFELVSIGESGYLEVSFQHAVLDHPDNPHGSDFIVFGNGFQNLVSGRWTNGNPHLSITGTNGNYELGLVSVSQDGENWLTLTNGPFADGFAPTLGRVYDPALVDTNPGAWNAWWGGATDPTLPLPPSLMPSAWSNLSVAAISERYRGSAGGTAFDIAGLNLAPDPVTGHKWIRHVRVARIGVVNPEVDAVADVSPTSPYDRWRMEQFAWRDAPAQERDDADADGDGNKTLLEYVVGYDPAVMESESPLGIALDEHGMPRVQTPASPPDVELMVESCRDLIAAEWCVETGGEDTRLFLRLGARHD